VSRDKHLLIAALVDAETQSPGPRSSEVLAMLQRLAALCEPRGATPRAVDRRILRALELAQARLAEGWTVESWARAVGMSRAAFARKFVATFGVSPLQHLHKERMLRAAALLADTDDALGAIAAAVGYQSEFAFSRAFKRHHGIAPGTYRRQAVQSTTAPRMLLAA
jgi:AraC-like DNA-binding protein